MDNQTCQGCGKYRCVRAQTRKSLYASDTGMSKDIDLVMNVVTRTSDLVSACQRLRGVDYITVDTEFIRDNTYWPQICLIQVASEDEAIAIDPLSRDLELKPFLEILTDENVLKVFHAARQDVEIFYQLGEAMPAPLFDTQLAAMVCGFGDAVGYDTLVQRLLGHTIDKSSRLSNWSRRPLTRRQIQYALDDVVHLRDVYTELERRVRESGREQWLAEELAVLINPNTYVNLPEEAWRRLRSRNAKPRHMAMLREIAAWREREAQSRNIPRNRILRDQALTEIAAHPPKNTADLQRLRNFPRGAATQANGQAILRIVSQVMSMPEEALPRPQARSRPNKGKGPIVDLLKVLLKAKCEEHGVAQKLVATVDDLERIAAGGEREIPPLTGWRHEIFGKDALRLKRGEVALTADSNGVRLIGTDPDGSSA